MLAVLLAVGSAFQRRRRHPHLYAAAAQHGCAWAENVQPLVWCEDVCVTSALPSPFILTLVNVASVCVVQTPVVTIYQV